MKTESNGKDKYGEYIAGRNAVREAFSSDPSSYNKLLLAKSISPAFDREIRSLAREAGVPVQTVPTQKLDKVLKGVNHQGVALSISAVAYLSVHELLSTVAPTLDDVRTRQPVILILDHIQDPYNLGAMLRTAVAAGVAGVVIPDRDAAPVNASAMKTSAGMAKHIRIARTPRLTDVFDELKERGYWIVGTDSQAEMTIWEMDWDRPIAVVIGSEEKGMKPTLIKRCDYLVSIPIGDNVESLNASVAAGIVLFESARVRLTKPTK